MKKLVVICMSLLLSLGLLAQDELSPYFKVSTSDAQISVLAEQVKETIKSNGFEVIGSYHPAENKSLFVICFTNNELRELSLQFPDRGALASVLKAGLVEKDGKTTLSILNPEYMFLAYWGKQLNGQEEQLKTMSDQVLGVFKSMGDLSPFGGSVDREDLPNYHYKMMMPYFDDPDDLNDFASFEEGLATIRKNLEANKANTVKVYEQVFEDKKIAVFGVGLWDKEDGEAHFLPIIGEDHIANMPYEIILQQTQASSLPGKYRIAIFWPELTMGTFMKIMSTPGDIVDALEAVSGK